MRPFSFATAFALAILATAHAEPFGSESALEAADASMFEKYVASHLRAYHHRVTPETKKDQVPAFSSSPLAHGAASHLSHLSSLLENAHDFSVTAPTELGRKSKVAFRHAYLTATRPLKRFFPMLNTTPVRESKLLVKRLPKQSQLVKRSAEEDTDDHEGSDWSWLDGDDEGEDDEEKLFDQDEILPSGALRMELRTRRRKH